MGAWQHVYVKLGLSEQEYKNLLCDLYWNQQLSQQQIASKLDAHVDTIEKNFRRYNISTRTISEANVLYESKTANLTEHQFEILDGILLADGYLDPSPVSARLTYGSEHRATLVDIDNVFEQVSFSTPWQSKKNDNWYFKSAFCVDLKTERERWYPKSKKIVPEDVRITPLSAYWWFVGDGYQVDYGLHLCTECFTDFGLGILIEKLNHLGFASIITPSRRRLRICGKSAPAFLNWITDSVRVADQYVYKWNSHRRQSEKINCPINQKLF